METDGGYLPSPKKRHSIPPLIPHPSKRKVMRGAAASRISHLSNSSPVPLFYSTTCRSLPPPGGFSLPHSLSSHTESISRGGGGGGKAPSFASDNVPLRRTS
ncbi:hypothetical protein CDAR_76511 [Caerostris darwini]|uniref:Uncharacterized protein n=1 Tax=Caerostris darwini TaxID=1538125 RepID=A0AAV4QDK4_9ARAC|nr:hypothetical protein CDAR_76511 [Caerostris darwini]